MSEYTKICIKDETNQYEIFIPFMKDETRKQVSDRIPARLKNTQGGEHK